MQSSINPTLRVLKGMRRPRQIVQGARYHVIARVNRQEFILESDLVKEMFLEALAQSRDRYEFTVDTLCIMSNHVHLLIQPGKSQSLSRIMQWILSVFAIRYNRMCGVTGHVWYDRFKSSVLGSLRQFIRAYHYIVNNPVRAGIVETADEYHYGGLWCLLDGRLGPNGPPSWIGALLSRRDDWPQSPKP